MPALRLLDFSALNLTAFGDQLYFTPGSDIPSSSGHINQLWSTNGTTSGTKTIKDIANTATSPSYLTVVGNNLLFMADDGTNGRELWISNGTAQGTTLLKDIYAGADSGAADSYGGFYRYATRVGGTLFFQAATKANGWELWKSDGTAQGTVLVKDIDTRKDSYGYGYGSYPTYLTPFGKVVLFMASTAAAGYELWKSDGTSNGTVMIKDINTSTYKDFYGKTYGYSSYPNGFAIAGATVFFAATNTNSDRELWKTDGTSSGTVLVKNINPNQDSYGYSYSSSPEQITAVGSSVFFLADGGSGSYDLWVSSGLAANTLQLAPNSFSYADQLTAVGMTLFFVATDASGDTELWKSDGTTAGTTRVANINSANSSNPDQLIRIGAYVYFTADDGINGRELWRSDGSTTELLEDINPGAASSDPDSLTATSNGLYFNATGATGPGLWRTDLPSRTAPRISQVAVSGTSVVLSFNEPVKTLAGTALASHYWVYVGTTLLRPTAAALNAAGTDLTLTLASAPTSAQSVEVFYAPPVGSGNGILVSRSTNLALQPQSVNETTTASVYRSTATVSSLGTTYTRLELLGTSAINATGNAAANVIRGNSAVNVITGLAGLDDLDGAEGGDIYLYTAASEHGDGVSQRAECRDSGTTGVDEIRFAATSTAGGSQLVLQAAETGIERVTIGTGTSATASTTGTTALAVDASAAANALILTGNAGANSLIGSSFNDTFYSNAGNDSITGNGGADTFVFNTTPNASTNRDTINDFQAGTDKLTFSRTTYAGVKSLTAITSAQLLNHSGTITGATASTRFLFNTVTKVLSYDADGFGSTSRAAPIDVAVLTGVSSLAFTDFALIT